MRASLLVIVACSIAGSPLVRAQASPDVPPPDSIETLGSFSMAYPFPSPDGTRLAFQGDFDGRWQLYALSLETGRTERLSTSEADDTQPAFSPDGRRLAFTSNEPGNDDLYLLDLATGERRALAPHPGKDGHPKWSADGEWIVFNRTFDPEDRNGGGDAAILRVRPDGSDLDVISDTEHIETFASFSPDAESVVFVEWFPNAAGEPARNGELVVVHLPTGTRTRLTENDVFDGYPYWGPSGDWIYFTSFTVDAEGQPNAAVHRIAPTGGTAAPVTPVDGVIDVRGIPSPDEARIYFNTSEGGRTLIRAVPMPAAR